MKAFEFETLLNAEHTIKIPEEIFGQLGLPAGNVRVMILVDEDEEEDRDWLRFASRQFFQGYDQGDSIYDNL